MEWIFRWLRSYLTCRLKGGDMERFFNLCRYQGIECWDMSFEEGVCRCCMYLEDFWKIRPFARKTRVRVRIEKRCGLAFFMNFLRRRKGWCIGMAGCIAILCFLSAHIWKMEFYGNSYYTDERLTKYLDAAEGISFGIWKTKIDGPLLEENLRLTFPDISWVSVRMEGTSLIVELEEMVKYDASAREQVLPRYICASEEGEIVSMVTRSGVPEVTIGNTVRKGELMIDGVMEILDESMTVAESIPVGADGDIWAKVTENYSKTYPASQESRNYGRAVRKFTLSIGGHTVTFGKNPYENDGEMSYDHLTEFYNWWPGIYVQADIFRPYTNIPSWTSFSQLKSRAESELSDLIHEFEDKGVQILENNVKILMYEDRVEAAGNFVLIKPIGEGTDILPEDTQNDEIGETDEYNGNDD